VVAILRHGISGELYAAAYADGVSMATLTSIVGPVDASTALDMMRDGYDIPADASKDLDWAHNQPWSPLSLRQVERAADAWA